MREIDYLEWILNSDLLQKGADALTMVEPAIGDNKEQRVTIVNSSASISKMSLYCFNTSETNAEKILPFFNKSKVDPKAPRGLVCFCDYILLVQHNKGLFVFFLEMKRGMHRDASKQIDASSVFFDYVLKSAERIKAENGCQDFDSKQVRYRRIVINEEYSNKKVTKDKDLEDADMDSVLIHKCHSEFRPIGYCK